MAKKKASPAKTVYVGTTPWGERVVYSSPAKAVDNRKSGKATLHIYEYVKTVLVTMKPEVKDAK